MEDSSPLHKALITIKKLKEMLIEKKKLSFEPIAIVGLSCRFPHASNKEDYWEMLSQGKNVISQFPDSRWELLKGTREEELRDSHHPYWGGFLEKITDFDAYFFGITPREATLMDPQQRLLLEVAYEAFEDAGLTLGALAGSQTGVFMSLYASQFGYLQNLDDAMDALYIPTGNASSMAANRLSYLFDLRGPSLVLDTACSSSLVALHIACLNLQNQLCDLAVVGGVNINLLPSINATLAKANMLSPTGQCHTFSAEANGYAQGEGVGVVVLKPLSAALKDQDRIYATIVGSAINQDGKTNGLTAPNGLQQEKLLKDAYKIANVNPEDVSYIECHGTGTFLGDPIEIQALGEVVGKNREHPCLIGSVKTNLGHLEPAAGMASVIKVALSLSRSQIPPHLNLTEINPHINFKKYKLEIPTVLQPWPNPEAVHVAGVSGFGFGGTNVHLVMEQCRQPRHCERSAAIQAPYDTQHVDCHAPLAMTSASSLDCEPRHCERSAAIQAPYDTQHVDCHASLAMTSASSLDRQPRHCERSAAIQAPYNTQHVDCHAPLAMTSASSLDRQPRHCERSAAIQAPYDTQHVECHASLAMTSASSLDRQPRHCERSAAIQAPYDTQHVDCHAPLAMTSASSLDRQPRHCERSAAIQAPYNTQHVDCHASLAMTSASSAMTSASSTMTSASSVMTPAPELFTLSAKDNTALNNLVERWCVYLESNPSSNLAQLCYLSHTRRSHYQKRLAIIATSTKELYHHLHTLKSNDCVHVNDETKTYCSQTLLTLADSYLNQTNINWTQYEKDRHFPHIDLPIYPWQHKTYWPTFTNKKTITSQGHPFKANQIKSPLSTQLFEFHFDTKSLPEIEDTNGILHAGYFLEMLSNATHTLFGNSNFTLEDFTFTSPIFVVNELTVTVQLHLEKETDTHYHFHFYSINNNQSEWSSHATGKLITTQQPTSDNEPLEAIKSRCKQAKNAETFFQKSPQ